MVSLPKKSGFVGNSFSMSTGTGVVDLLYGIGTTRLERDATSS